MDELEWMQTILRSSLTRQQKITALEWWTGDRSGSPPAWLEPWLERRHGAWRLRPSRSETRLGAAQS
jgi:hypothetical protein